MDILWPTRFECSSTQSGEDWLAVLPGHRAIAVTATPRTRHPVRSHARMERAASRSAFWVSAADRVCLAVLFAICCKSSAARRQGGQEPGRVAYVDPHRVRLAHVRMRVPSPRPRRVVGVCMPYRFRVAVVQPADGAVGEVAVLKHVRWRRGEGRPAGLATPCSARPRCTVCLPSDDCVFRRGWSASLLNAAATVSLATFDARSMMPKRRPCCDCWPLPRRAGCGFRRACDSRS